MWKRQRPPGGAVEPPPHADPLCSSLFLKCSSTCPPLSTWLLAPSVLLPPGGVTHRQVPCAEGDDKCHSQSQPTECQQSRCEPLMGPAGSPDTRAPDMPTPSSGAEGVPARPRRSSLSLLRKSRCFRKSLTEPVWLLESAGSQAPHMSGSPGSPYSSTKRTRWNSRKCV